MAARSIRSRRTDRNAGGSADDAGAGLLFSVITRPIQESENSEECSRSEARSWALRRAKELSLGEEDAAKLRTIAPNRDRSRIVPGVLQAKTLLYMLHAFDSPRALKWRPRRSTAAPFSLEAVPPPSLHGDLDCEPRRQYRHLDVYGRVELANDQPQSRSADRLARAGRCQPADVPARHTGGGPCRHHRPAALPDYRRGRQYGDRRRLCSAHLAQSRDRGPLTPIHGSDQRVRGVHGAHLAGGDPAARAQAGPACRDRGEQHRLQS